MGPSGSGKSTLALAIAGLVPHEIPGTANGWLEVDGVDAALGADIRGRAGIVFQDPDRQLVMERVEDDVAFGLENLAWDHATMRRRVPEALRDVGLLGFERRRPNRLSGGEQQRLALAGVLAPKPGVLVLDEPTANLDPAAATALFLRLARLREARRTTIVLIEHRPDEAWQLADQVLALGGDGRPIDLGPPGDVLARSRDAMTAAGIWLPSQTLPRRGRRPDRPAPPEVSEPPLGQASAAGALVAAEAYGAWYSYERRKPVLCDVEVAISPGERVALVGPNGSGKSTLARLLVGLLRPDRGLVRLASRDPAVLAPETLARLAGYVFQDPERQFLTGSVRDEVYLGLRRHEAREVPELMARLNLPLEAFGRRNPYRLSGGEQRRLSLACVLVRRPDLLVLDEPTFGQDRHGYDGLLAILADRLAEGSAILAVTHDERLVRDLAARRIEMSDGRIVSHGWSS